MRSYNKKSIYFSYLVSACFLIIRFLRRYCHWYYIGVVSNVCERGVISFCKVSFIELVDYSIKMKNCIFLLVIISFSPLVAQNKSYWNTNTQLIPWRIPLVTDKSTVTYEDLTGDGTPDIIRTFILDKIPVMWIDDDGDMQYGDTEGDTDNDCLLIDLNKDGIFGGPDDLCIDWVDTDNDGIADIQIVVNNGKEDVRYRPDYTSDFIIVIDIEKDDIKTFIDWNKLLPLCWEKNGHSNFYQDYHGNTLLLKGHNSIFRVADPRFNCENPFIFYDFDRDNLTEMVLRLMDVPYVRSRLDESVDNRLKKVNPEHDILYSQQISWASIAWDMDNDNGQGNEFDLDMTIHFAGEGFNYSDHVHTFENLRGLPEADKYIYDPRWRQMEELVYPDESVAYDMVFQKGKWDYCWFVFDEDDDCNRWERVEVYYPNDIFRIGAGKGGLDSHKQSDAIGDRGEFDIDNSGKGKLYLSPIDGRIHLYGAEWGAWRIDQGASYFQGYGGLYDSRHIEQRLYSDPELWATVKYTDTNNNGFFDLIEYDLNGDKEFEETISLIALGIDDSGTVFDPAVMSYDEMQELFKQSAQNSWRRAQKAIQVAEKYNLNTSWYAFWKQPRSQFEKYAYGYWLNFYLYRDLKQISSEAFMPDFPSIVDLDKAYYSGDWDGLLK